MKKLVQHSPFLALWLIMPFALFFVMLFAKKIQAQQMNTEQIFEKTKTGATLIEVKNSGKGSGFLVNANGYIVTNYHVIEGAEYYPQNIKITFGDDDAYTVQSVISYDKRIDLALLKINKLYGNKQVLPIIPDNEGKMGSEVATVGNPLGQGFTITNGVISNLNPASMPDHILQTNTSINAGNSGGALLNKNGQIVGVIVAKIVGKGVEGFGYAIKAEYLRNFLRKNDIDMTNAPLITDTQLKEARQMTEEEKEAEKQKELARLRTEKMQIEEKAQLDAQLERERQRLKLENETAEAERKQKIKNAQNENERKRISEEVEYRKIERQKEILRLEDQKAQRKAERKARRAELPYRVSLKLGLGVQYYFTDYMYGSPIVPPQQSQNRPNQQASIKPMATAMLAYRFNITKKGSKERGHSIGLFGVYSLVDEYTMTKMYNNNIGFIPVSDILKTDHYFYELEAGGLIREWFRMSGGMGIQNYETSEKTRTLEYYTATMGFVMRFGMVELDANFTGLMGGFYASPSGRASVTLNIHFKGIK